MVDNEVENTPNPLPAIQGTIEHQRDMNKIREDEIRNMKKTEEDFKKLQEVAKTISSQLAERNRQYDDMKSNFETIKIKTEKLEKENRETKEYLEEMSSNSDIASLRKDKIDFERLKKLSKLQADKIIKENVEMEKMVDELSNKLEKVVKDKENLKQENKTYESLHQEHNEEIIRLKKVINKLNCVIDNKSKKTIDNMEEILVENYDEKDDDSDDVIEETENRYY